MCRERDPTVEGGVCSRALGCGPFEASFFCIVFLVRRYYARRMLGVVSVVFFSFAGGIESVKAGSVPCWCW